MRRLQETQEELLASQQTLNHAQVRKWSPSKASPLTHVWWRDGVAQRCRLGLGLGLGWARVGVRVSFRVRVRVRAEVRAIYQTDLSTPRVGVHH